MPLSLERLEDRLLLAATVTQKGTTLVIVDDGGGQDVILTGGELGDVTVEGATSGDGEFTGIKNIKITGGEGGDFYVLRDIHIAGKITADLKDGNDLVTIDGAATDIAGGLAVKTGAGQDRVLINASTDDGPIHIGKNVLIDLGDVPGPEDDFEDECSLGGSVAANNEVITIDGNLTIKGKAGKQLIHLDSIDVGKNVKLDLGAANDDVEIGFNSQDPDLAVNVGGSMTIKVGDGDDEVDFGDDYFTGYFGSVDIAKNLTVDLGNSDEGEFFEIDMTDAGDDSFHVGGNVTVKGKDGHQRVTIDGAEIGKNVNINLGDGDDLLQVGQKGGEIPTTIGGNLIVKLGDGDDDVDAQDVTISGNANLDGGTGSEDEINDTDLGSVVIEGSPTLKNFEFGNLLP